MATKKVATKKVTTKVVKDTDLKVTKAETKPEGKVSKTSTYEGRVVLDVNVKVINGKTYKEVRCITGEVFVVDNEEFKLNFKK